MQLAILKSLYKYVTGEDPHIKLAKKDRFQPRYAPIPINKKHILEHKHREDITSDTYKAIKLLAIKPEDVTIYGSFIYKAQPYPGDIDTYESIRVCPKGCTRQEANKIAMRMLQDMIDKAVKTPGVFLGDTKICIDKDFFQFIQHSHWGNVYGDGRKLKLYDFKYDKCVNDLDEMLKTKIITKESYDTIMKLLKEKPTILEWLELMEEIRNLIVLRWSYKEIMQGYKILPIGRELTLPDAINSCEHANFDPNQSHGESNVSMIKPDFWIKVNDKYLELSDLLMFDFINEKGKLSDISHFRPRRNELIDSLKEDIAKYYYSPLPKHYNPLKYAKRIFSLALIMKDKKTADKLAYLWKSDYNILNQIKAEIDTIISMLENVKSPPLKELKKQCDQFKLRLSTLLNVPIDKRELDDLTKIARTNISTKEMIKLLENMNSKFKKIIAKGTVTYLKKVSLWPAPKKYLNVNNFTTIVS